MWRFIPANEISARDAVLGDKPFLVQNRFLVPKYKVVSLT